MSNDVLDFKKQIWDRRIQMDLNKSLVSLPLARFAFSEVRGATRFHRPAKTRLYSQSYTAETAMNVQSIGSADEYLDVDQTKAVPIFIDATQELDSQYDLVSMYAPEMTYALKNEMDGKFLAEVSNAFYTVGKLDIEGSGTNENGITATAALFAKILSYSKAKLLQNRVEGTTPFFVVLEPTILANREQLLVTTGNAVADTTLRNGYLTSINSLGLDVYVSNNLKHTITLTSTKNLAADDKITIGWVSAVLKAVPAVAGEVDLWGDEAATLANLAAYFNGTGTAGTTYIDMTQDNRAKLKQNLVSVVAAAHTLAITTAGYVAVSEDVDSGTAYSLGEHQCLSPLGQKGCIDMVIQKSVVTETQSGISNGLIGKYITTWTRYGIKTFEEWKQRMLAIRFKMG